MKFQYEDLVGSPFKLHGRDPKRGIDCMGLVLEVYRRAGIAVADPLPSEPYPAEYDAAFAVSTGLDSEQWAHTDGNYLPGDILVINEGACGVPLHVAVAIDRQWMIHAVQDFGVILTRIARFHVKIVDSLRYIGGHQ